MKKKTSPFTKIDRQVIRVSKLLILEDLKLKARLDKVNSNNSYFLDRANITESLITYLTTPDHIQTTAFKTALSNITGWSLDNLLLTYNEAAIHALFSIGAADAGEKAFLRYIRNLKTKLLKKAANLELEEVNKLFLEYVNKILLEVMYTVKAFLDTRPTDVREWYLNALTKTEEDLVKKADERLLLDKSNVVYDYESLTTYINDATERYKAYGEEVVMLATEWIYDILHTGSRNYTYEELDRCFEETFLSYINDEPSTVRVPVLKGAN